MFKLCEAVVHDSRVCARVILLIVLVALAAPAAAQQTGTLTGVVRDAQGGVLPGVTVTRERRGADRRRAHDGDRRGRQLPVRRCRRAPTP